MSWKASAWAKSTRGHKGYGSKALLMVLADYHDDERGYAWPSQKRLAEDCEMPLRTVQYLLYALENAGFIRKLRKGNQYQPSQYELIFSVVYAQIGEGAKNEGATIAGTSEPAISNIVNPQPSTSEPVTAEHTSLQEPPNLEPSILNVPRWLEILGQDPRWPRGNLNGYAQDLEKSYPKIDLVMQAHSAYEWLQTTKGLKKTSRGMKVFWNNWLTKASQDKDRTQNSAPAPPARRGATRQEIVKDWKDFPETF